MYFVESLSACVGTIVKLLLLSCSPEGCTVLTILQNIVDVLNDIVNSLSHILSYNCGYV